MLSVIEFQDQTGEIMVARVPIEGTGEFVMGSQLIVQDGQMAVFYRDGQPTDKFKAGRHTLNTRNLPIITKLLSLPVFGTKSPFRAYVYFLQLKTFTKLGWGTPTPILFRDTEFKAVHLRAHGAFSMRINAPNTFLSAIVGSKGLETTFAIEEYIRSIIISHFANTLPKILTTVLDLPTHYMEIAVGLKQAVKTDLEQYGLELVDLMVEAITVPPEVQTMIDRAAGSRSLDQGELQRYQTMAVSDAVRDSSKQPGSGITDALGLGVGIAMGQQMATPKTPQPPEPPPLDNAALWYIAIAGQRKGPYGEEAMRVRIELGEVTSDTLVWRQGMAGWMPAGQLPELVPLFYAEPPPLP